MARYGKHGEQTYRQNFNRKKKDCIDWLLLNLSLARRVLDMDGLLAIAIDPCYISKAGKKTPHIGRFWSGCAQQQVHDAACPSDNRKLRAEDEEQDTRRILHQCYEAVFKETAEYH